MAIREEIRKVLALVYIFESQGGVASEVMVGSTMLSTALDQTGCCGGFWGSAIASAEVWMKKAFESKPPLLIRKGQRSHVFALTDSGRKIGEELSRIIPDSIQLAFYESAMEAYFNTKGD